MASVPISSGNNTTTTLDICREHYPNSLCNFGTFSWNLSLFLNVILLLPQIYKLHRKKRYQNVANGLSLFWLFMVCCTQTGNWRWLARIQDVVSPGYAIFMDVWLFACGLALMCYTLALSESHFDYQRPVTLAITLLMCGLILSLSLLGRTGASVMRGLSNILSTVQIYPQLLLSELLGTSKAISVWTAILLFMKYCLYYISQYILYMSLEELIFAYMSTCMFLIAIYHCFAYPGILRTLPGSTDISRSHFAVFPAPRSTDRAGPRNPTSAVGTGIDAFFSIDDFDNSEIDNTPVNLPTVTPRLDGGRSTIACLNWYTMSILIGVTSLLLTASLVWKVLKFSVILAPLCVIFMIVSIFSVKHFLPDRILVLVKLIL